MSTAAITFALARLDAAEIERLWRTLELRADVTLFLSWAWIGTWIAEAGPPDLVLVGRADGEVVSLGLLRRATRRRHGFVRSRTLCLHETGDPARDIVFIEYNGLLTDRRFDPAEAQAIAYLRSSSGMARRFDEVQFGGLSAPRYETLVAAGYRTQVRACKRTAQVDLDAVRAAGGDYLVTLSANTRQQIRRAVRLYEARGPLTLRTAASVEEAHGFFAALGALHERRWRAKGVDGGAWRYPFLVAFHRRLIDTIFTTGGVELVRISCGGDAIGYLYNLRHGGWIGSYLSGFAYEDDNRARPGLVSFALYIQDRLNSDAQTLDFLAGDDRYKTSLGRQGPAMYWLHVQQPRAQFAIEDALRRAKNLLRPPRLFRR